MAKYGVKLVMSALAHSQLIESGLKLYAFKAVGSDNSDYSGGTVVWVFDPHFGRKSTIAWYDDCSGYFASEDVMHGYDIGGSLGHSVEVGGGLKIVENNEWATIEPDPHWEEPDWIRIDNRTSTTFAVGLSQTAAYTSSAPGSQAPVGSGHTCAFELKEQRDRRIKPLRQVLITFSHSTFEPGTIITRALEDNFDGCLAYGEYGPNYPVVEITDEFKWTGGKTIAPSDFINACIQPEKSI